MGEFTCPYPKLSAVLAILYNDVIMGKMASQITSVTGLCEGNSPGTGEFPAQRSSNTENVSIWWRHHVFVSNVCPREMSNGLD